jgi:glucosamine--fructose-6-phosphate aminotransferase (isomerizing)
VCGIVAARTAGPVGPYLVSALTLLEYRGYDSAGVAIRTAESTTATLRTTGRVGALAELLGAWNGPDLLTVGIGHTRWATHGSVSESNAHPHHDCINRVSVAHNGIIENSDSLRRELEERGHVFSSDVDSEVVCHLVEEGLAAGYSLLDSVIHTTDELAGSWALAVIDAQTGQLVAAAHRSPLLIAHSALGDFVTSDIAAVAEWVTEFTPLRDYDVVALGDEVVWTTRGEPIAARSPIPCLWRGAATQLGKHTDFMAKEIDEQPEIAARILDQLTPGIADGSVWRNLDAPGFQRIAVIGCGTSLNAGRVIAAAFGGLGGVPHSSLVASEAAESIFEPGTLVLALSQSGETADILRALDRIEPSSGSTVIALTNNPHSSLARRAASVVNCQAGPEIGVAATKTFVAQVVTGVAVAVSALVATGRLDRGGALRLVDDMRRIPDLLAQALAVSNDRIPAIVERVQGASGFLFLGRGPGVTYAGEGALKLKELSYRWAEHYPAGELKHGPLALVEAGTPVVVIDNGDPRLESNIAEVEARGGDIIRIGGAGTSVPALGLSVGRPLSGGMDRWGPLESVVPLQVLARQLAIALHLDVDKPRNLAKSVTVE